MKIDDLHIWCLNLVTATDRHDEMIKQFEKIDINDKVEFYYNTNLPIYNYFGQLIKSFHTNWYTQLNYYCQTLFGRILSCALGWYNIMKISYVKGYEYIMCFEDDVEININKDQLDYILNHLPDDFDVIKLLYPSTNYGDIMISADMINDNLPPLEIHNPDISPLFDNYEMTKCNGWFIINRKAMKIWCDVMENPDTFIYGDGTLENKNLQFYNIRYRVAQLKQCESLIIKPNNNVDKINVI